MPRTLTPAIRKSDALAAERQRATALDHWPEASFKDARATADERRRFAYGWCSDEPLDGSDSVADDEARLVGRRGK